MFTKLLRGRCYHYTIDNEMVIQRWFPWQSSVSVFNHHSFQDCHVWPNGLCVVSSGVVQGDNMITPLCGPKSQCEVPPSPLSQESSSNHQFSVVFVFTAVRSWRNGSIHWALKKFTVVTDCGYLFGSQKNQSVEESKV